MRVACFFNLAFVTSPPRLALSSFSLLKVLRAKSALAHYMPGSKLLMLLALLKYFLCLICLIASIFKGHFEGSLFHET